MPYEAPGVTDIGALVVAVVLSLSLWAIVGAILAWKDKRK